MRMELGQKYYFEYSTTRECQWKFTLIVIWRMVWMMMELILKAILELVIIIKIQFTLT